MIEKLRESFQEEARELLTELEAALLELDEKRDDQELIGRAFRALHTIKGSGSMFGFNDISSFVHHLESAFERLRTGEIQATNDLIRLALAAGDQIAEMLNEAAGLGSASQARTAELLSDLARLTEATTLEQPVLATGEHATRSSSATTAPSAWRIWFRPGPRLQMKGNSPLLLLRDLKQLGEVQVRVDTSGLPKLSEMDPERCYLGWEITLTTREPLDAIRDVFLFVEDDCELQIQPAAPVVAAKSTPTPAAVNASAGGPGVASSIRVSVDKLDCLVNLVGELVTVQARLGALAGKREDPDILAISEEVERLTTSLRENSISIRMLPLRATFERFRRLVHDLSIELHKEVELTFEGADTELDKTVIDQLNDPLVHLVRNSMDHGIERPEVRRAAGKSGAAAIHLSAQHSGTHVLIQVSDNGAGLNKDAVRARAIERGLIAANAELTDSEIVNLILSPGFSTARQVTDLSGRGVGMDVVRRSVEGLRGSIDVSSKPGLGTTVMLRLPLTLAIIDGLLVRVGQTHFVIPLANSLECIELTKKDIEAARGNRVANVRGQIVPYIRLSEFFQMNTMRPDCEQIMVVETELGRYGFVVDAVLGDHQTVIKSLGKLYRNIQVVSGATILGDGTVALILDPHRLVQQAVRMVFPGKTAKGHNAGVPLLQSGRQQTAATAFSQKEHIIHAN